MDRDELGALIRATVPCVGFHTRRAARLVSQHYDRALAPAGLRVTQFSLLSAASLADGILLSDLAVLLATDRTSLTRALAPLERDGLLTSSPGTDRRKRIINLTDRGRRVLDEATPLWRGAQDALVSRIGEERWEHLMIELHRVSRIVESL
jgi:DNA-binding MarR family transcriptional regulator